MESIVSMFEVASVIDNRTSL